MRIFAALLCLLLTGCPEGLQSHAPECQQARALAQSGREDLAACERPPRGEIRPADDPLEGLEPCGAEKDHARSANAQAACS